MGLGYTPFISRALFPAHEWLKGHSSVAARKRLEISQWYSPEEIEAEQSRRLRTFLHKISDQVPYYRNLFADVGFELNEIADASALQQLPFLTKDIVRSNSAELTSASARNLVRMNTGGSTGEPMVFMVGRERISHDIGAKWRATRWWGVDIGDPELVVWGSPIELGKQDRIKAWRDWLMRSRLFSAFDMSVARIDELIDTLLRRPPRMLFGYPSALALVAQRARERNVDLRDSGIKVAFVTAERCYPYQRDAIEGTFGCPVANGYGGRDAGFVAHECPRGSVHISAEDIIIEIVDAGGNVVPAGTSGEIVVTHLATADFPFVRYRTGDMGVRSKSLCSCGRGLPVLEEISGRTTDFIRATDGTLMHGLALIYVLRDLDGIVNFKIIQEREELVRVQIVPNGHFDATIKSAVQAGLRQRLGAGMQVDIELVEGISPEKSGKYRYVVSALESAAASVTGSA